MPYSMSLPKVAALVLKSGVVVAAVPLHSNQSKRDSKHGGGRREPRLTVQRKLLNACDCILCLTIFKSAPWSKYVGRSLVCSDNDESSMGEAGVGTRKREQFRLRLDNVGGAVHHGV